MLSLALLLLLLLLLLLRPTQITTLDCGGGGGGGGIVSGVCVCVTVPRCLVARTGARAPTNQRGSTQPRKVAVFRWLPHLGGHSVGTCYCKILACACAVRWGSDQNQPPPPHPPYDVHVAFRPEVDRSWWRHVIVAIQKEFC